MISSAYGAPRGVVLRDAGPTGDEMPTAYSPSVEVTYVPILDVARGQAAGYQAQARFELPDDAETRTGMPVDLDAEGALTARAIRIGLDAAPTLPTNTFVTLPVASAVAAKPAVREVLTEHGDLRGVVLDITGFNGGSPVGELESALAWYRELGARIAVGGNGAAQPELTSIVRLKPAIMRLGRDWVRGVDGSDAKRSAIEVIGQLAGQLDAWILAEGVSTTAELRALSGLAVPLAQGPLIGSAHGFWPSVELPATQALPKVAPHSDGVLRTLLQQAYTTGDLGSAAAVLPDTTGFDVVVVLDDFRRPTSLLEHDGPGGWAANDVLAVNIDTPVADAVSRAMLRPRPVRFTPLACTDAAGRYVGILRIEKLMAHLANDRPASA